ncbi:hypothetical protein ACFPT7_20235 [Acidicapsa dinghuensis]|uniref:Uncharacterized protein n=1 Tax=Acidicapsa dinghuensis TaxID=2218256 RepID=A0ABW1EK75_9BACT|nr:hypothetical protein [Acidicapsa dinghuensis]
MLLYTATDKEIHDLLISQRQQFTMGVLLELGRSRNIFYSREEQRDDLVKSLSALTYGFNQITELQKFNDLGARTESTTTIRLKGKFTDTDVRAIVDEYRNQEALTNDIQIITGSPTKNRVSVGLKYTETDFSKTRLRQRRKREANIDIDIDSDGITVTLPVNSTAIAVSKGIKQKFDARANETLPEERVDFSLLTSSGSRTRFFTDLIGGLPKFELADVVSVRVKASVGFSPENEESDQESDPQAPDNSAEASDELKALVREVALSGSSVLLSSHYKDLREGGFYIVSIRWRSKQIEAPYHLFDFTAGIDEPELGQGFKFAVKGTLIRRSGGYVKTWRNLDEEDRKSVLRVLDVTAIQVFRRLVVELSGESGIQQ